jgi:hypothetical protein
MVVKDPVDYDINLLCQTTYTMQTGLESPIIQRFCSFKNYIIVADSTPPHKSYTFGALLNDQLFINLGGRGGHLWNTMCNVFHQYPRLKFLNIQEVVLIFQ